jgi:hypothetical protein
MENPFAVRQQQAIPLFVKKPTSVELFFKKDPLLVVACLAN